MSMDREAIKRLRDLMCRVEDVRTKISEFEGELDDLHADLEDIINGEIKCNALVERQIPGTLLFDKGPCALDKDHKGDHMTRMALMKAKVAQLERDLREKPEKGGE